MGIFTSAETTDVEFVPDAVASDPAPDAPVVGNPEPADCEAMFAANPGLSDVLTTKGWLSRDGVLRASALGE